MRHSRSMLVAAATIMSVSLAGIAHAQGQPRARRTPPAAPPGAGAPGAAPNAAAPGARGERRGVARERLAGGGSPASGLLRLRSQLALTDDQVKRLESLRGANVPQRNPSEELRAQADLMDAMKGDGNLAAARAAMDRMHKVRTDRAVAQLKLRQDARAVLTADQKTKLDNMRGAFGERRQRMVAQGRGGFGPGAGRGGFGPGARGRDFGPGARMRQPGPGMPGMRQQGGPPRGQMGPGGMGPGGMGPRMRRGGEELDSVSINESRRDPRLGPDAPLPPNN